MSQDFKDLLAEFNAHQVDFLVDGAHALAAHGYGRASEVLDLWIRPTREKGQKVIVALVAFGAPLHDLSSELDESANSSQRIREKQPDMRRQLEKLARIV